MLSGSPAFQAAGLLATNSGLAPKFLRITVPVAQAGDFAIFRNSTNPGIVSFQSPPFIEAQLAGPALPQISRATIPTVVEGRTYTLSLDSTLISVAAESGDTADDIATALAAQIEALADYIGSSTGPQVTVVRAANNVPFTLGQSVINTAILIGNPVLIQAAT